MRYLIIGCGYLGQRVARLLLIQGNEVFALTRSSETATRFEADGLRPLVGDVMQADSLRFPQVDAVLWAVGYDRRCEHSKRDVYVTGLQNAIAALGKSQASELTARITYVSSTAVYGQDAATWVDESSVTQPRSEGGKICLEAENILQTACPSANIVRLAGIYGPQRLLRGVAAMKNSEPIAGNPDAYLNLIHVEDAARLVLAVSEVLESDNRIWLGADGHPPTRRDFYSELSRQLAAPEPVFDPGLPSRHGSGGLNKRCRSERLDEFSDFAFAYPSYREGLRHAIGSS